MSQKRVTNRRKEEQEGNEEQQDTPHGPLLQSCELAAKKGGNVTIEYVNPRALMWTLLLLQPFRDFMEKYAPRGDARIVWYADDVRPGNLHRPDKGRKYWAFCISVLELTSLWKAS